jgi:hypothetical protein
MHVSISPLILSLQVVSGVGGSHLLPVQWPLAQSESVSQLQSGQVVSQSTGQVGQGRQVPPQSMSVSSPSVIPLVQLAHVVVAAVYIQPPSRASLHALVSEFKEHPKSVAPLHVAELVIHLLDRQSPSL